MKQVFPRFCNPDNPKEPASRELPEKTEEFTRKQLEFTVPEAPFIISEAPDEFPRIEFANSSFFPSLHFIKSESPYTCNSSRTCAKNKI